MQVGASGINPIFLPVPEADDTYATIGLDVRLLRLVSVPQRKTQDCRDPPSQSFHSSRQRYILQ